MTLLNINLACWNEAACAIKSDNIFKNSTLLDYSYFEYHLIVMHLPLLFIYWLLKVRRKKCLKNVIIYLLHFTPSDVFLCACV